MAYHLSKFDKNIDKNKMNPIVLFYLHIKIDSTVLISKTGVIVVLYHEGAFSSCPLTYKTFVVPHRPMLEGTMI